MRDMNHRFHTELLKRQHDIKNTVFLTDKRYYQLIKDIANAKSKKKKKLAT